MKQNYKKLYEEAIDFITELTRKMNEAGVIYTHNYITDEIKVTNIKLEELNEKFMHTTNKYYADLLRSSNAKIEANKKLEELNKSYDNLKTDFEKLSDKYFTLNVEYDDLSDKCTELYQALTIKFNTYKEYIKLTEKNKNN